MPVTQDMTVTSSFPPIIIPKSTVYDLLLTGIEEFHEKVCETEFLSGRQETYESVLEKSLRIASFLQRNGLGPGDKIGIHCGNVLEYTQTALGIIRAGCTIVAIRGEAVREVRLQIEDARPGFVFTETSRAETVLQAAKGYDFCKGIISFGTAKGCMPLCDVLQDDGTSFRKPDDINSSQSVVLVTYSSGTTGVPKGVELTHTNLVFSFIVSEQVRDDSIESAVLVLFSPVHLSGSVTRLGNLYRRGHAVLLPGFETENVFQAIEKYRLRQLFLMPTNVSSLLNSSSSEKYDLSSWSVGIISGGSVSEHTRRKLIEKFKLKVALYVYGQTESLSNLLPCDDLKSIGVPGPNVEAKVVEMDSGKTLGPRQTGELCLKSPSIMKGYLNNVQATKNSIDEEGWLHTGDLVYYDEKGRFYFVERAKDIMKCKDSQVSPYELEEVLLSHPAVAEAVVIAIPHREFGEVPRAYVILKEPCQEDLVEFVAKQVADYKQLRGGLCIVENLPKSQFGKYLRRALQQEYLKNNNS